MKLLLLAFVSFVAPAFAANITGQWSVDGNLNGTPISFDCTFQQADKKLTGSCKAYQFSVTATGSVEEDTVQFSYIYNFAGEPYKCTYTGKLNGTSEVRGTIVVSGIEGSKGDFVARKS
jgi:hypothetical protein